MTTRSGDLHALLHRDARRAQGNVTGQLERRLHVQVTSIAAGGLDTLPHSPGLFLMFSVLGLNHKNAYRHVFACSVAIPVIVVVVATAICVFAGI